MTAGQVWVLVSGEGHSVPPLLDGLLIVNVCVWVPLQGEDGVQALQVPKQLTTGLVDPARACDCVPQPPKVTTLLPVPVLTIWLSFAGLVASGGGIGRGACGTST